MTTQELVERLYDRSLDIQLAREHRTGTPTSLLLQTAASRLSEMEAENKRLREVELFALAAKRWSDPMRRAPHTVVTPEELLSAIWCHPARPTLNHQQKGEEL